MSSSIVARSIQLIFCRSSRLGQRFAKLFLVGNFFQRAVVKQSRGRDLAGNAVNRMKIATLFLAALLLVGSLITGCGCLDAQSYDRSECRKYQTYWVASSYSND